MSGSSASHLEMEVALRALLHHPRPAAAAAVHEDRPGVARGRGGVGVVAHLLHRRVHAAAAAAAVVRLAQVLQLQGVLLVVGERRVGARAGRREVLRLRHGAAVVGTAVWVVPTRGVHLVVVMEVHPAAVVSAVLSVLRRRRHVVLRRKLLLLRGLGGERIGAAAVVRRLLHGPAAAVVEG